LCFAITIIVSYKLLNQ